MSAPAFLNKPKHKDNVIATPRGWVVEKTGELLVSVKNLDQRIAEHLGLPTFKFEPIVAEQHSAAEGLGVAVTAIADSFGIQELLNGLDDLPKTEEVILPAELVIAPVVEEVIKPVIEVPVVADKPVAPVPEKKRLGRPPKIRPVEAAPAPVAVMEA